MKLVEQIKFNIKLIGDVVGSIYPDDSFDLLTAIQLNIVYAETVVLLIQQVMELEKENHRLNQATSQSDNNPS